MVDSSAVDMVQVRRRMEDENRKARKAARREYNDNVRELASFVRKRDKRVSFFQVRLLLWQDNGRLLTLPYQLCHIRNGAPFAPA